MFRTVGSTVRGTNWQADVAEFLGCSASLITRLLGGTRNFPQDFHQMVQGMIIRQIRALTALLSLPGMPDADSDETAWVQDQILGALDYYPDDQDLKQVKWGIYALAQNDDDDVPKELTKSKKVS